MAVGLMLRLRPITLHTSAPQHALSIIITTIQVVVTTVAFDHLLPRPLRHFRRLISGGTLPPPPPLLLLLLLCFCSLIHHDDDDAAGPPLGSCSPFLAHFHGYSLLMLSFLTAGILCLCLRPFVCMG